MISVLYVDDEADLLEIGKHFLEMEDQLSVDMALTVSEAMAMLQSRAYDAIVSDYQMPEINGIEFLKRIRASGNTIPFIVFTGRGREEIVIQALNEGADFYLQKGGDPTPQFAELHHKVLAAVQRRQAEEDLKKREEQFRLLATNSTDVIWTMDLGGHFTYVSPSVERLRGFTPEEVMSQTIEEALTPADASTIRNLFLQIFDQIGEGKPLSEFRGELEQPRKDGSTVWTEVTSKGLYNERNDLIGIIGVSRDITERKKMEALLSEKSEEFERYFTRSLDLLCIANTKGEFIRLNPEWEKVLGYAVSDLEGKVFLDFVHPEDMDSTLEAVTKLSDQQEILNFVNRYRAKDGAYRWIEWRSRANGTTIYAVARDITDRKHVEEALRKANRQLNLLTSITRHDIRNKLMIILGFLRIAEKGTTDPGIAESLGKIRSATDAIGSQIEFTRVYENLGTHEPAWQNLDQTLHRDQFPAAISLNSIVTGVEVFADPMLERVFYNLLDNSVRHGMHVTEVRVSSRPDEQGLKIIWEDNGVGIEKDQKEMIFERGFGKNTGLGLFLVREILKLTDITIRENGEPGSGARFEISVPKGMYLFRP
jgi:PAS domain S-box-containing protein